MLLSQNILSTIKELEIIQKFLENIEDFEVFYKKLDQNEITRVNVEYPNLFAIQATTNIGKVEENIPQTTISNSISSLTLIKRDRQIYNPIKLKKVKIYVDENTDRIIKILEH